MFIRLKQNGDTIVEVLIVVAVIGLVIALGYSLATNSLNGVRVSQERSEATKIAESQVELLRYKLGQGDTDVKTVTTGDAFCIDKTTLDTNISPNCVQNSLYTVNIKRAEDSSVACFKEGQLSAKQNFNRYDVTVNWGRSGGGADQSLTLYYRYPTSECT